MKYCFVINPVAGRRSAWREYRSSIERAFQKNGLPYEIAVTESPGDASLIARRFAERNDSVRLMAIGGDGTLREVVAGVLGCDNAEVGCYPSGSGNDFIKYFGGREEFEDVEYIVGANAVPVDVMQVNGQCCLNLFCVGIDADVAHDIPKYRRLPLLGGAMAYNISLISNFFKRHDNPLTIYMGGGELRLDCLLLAVANGRVYGGGYHAAPEALMDDGLLDVVTVERIPRLRIAAIIPVYKRGAHIKDGRVIEKLSDIMTYNRVPDVRIVAKSDIAVNMDGELAVMREIEIGVKRRGLRFLLPKALGEGAGRG